MGSAEDRLARLEADRVLLRNGIADLRRGRLRFVTAYVMAVVTLVGVSALGTASALSGSNTVLSDDIVDSNVRTNDLSFKTVVNPTVVQNSAIATTSQLVAEKCPAGYQPINGWWDSDQSDVRGMSHGVEFLDGENRWRWNQWVYNDSFVNANVELTVLCAKNLPYLSLK